MVKNCYNSTVLSDRGLLDFGLIFRMIFSFFFEIIIFNGTSGTVVYTAAGVRTVLYP